MKHPRGCSMHRCTSLRQLRADDDSKQQLARNQTLDCSRLEDSRSFVVISFFGHYVLSSEEDSAQRATTWSKDQTTALCIT
eukprot:2755325-Pleurochrysis_carterae.AAC.2